jgi:hypothetical protein
MKKLLIFSLMAFGLSSCSKDSLDPATDNFSSIEKSEIIVTVTYLTWSDLECDLNCSGAGSQFISYIADAKVDVYDGDGSGNDQQGDGRKFGLTDKAGTILFKDLDPRQYTVRVDTPYGQKSRTIYTQLNKRSSIEFSF